MEHMPATTNRGGEDPTSTRILPLHTDLSKEWEVDKYEPARQVATVFYIQPTPQYDAEKPYFMNVPVDPAWGPNIKQTNVSYTRKRISITDVRGHENEFTLDKSGFQLGNLQTSLPYEAFADTEAIITSYYEEVKAFLLNHTEAVEVLPWDFQVRRNDPSLPTNSRGAPGKAQPFGAVHGDQTTKAAMRRLYHFYPEQAKKYSKGRFQIVNVWKPLRGPVRDAPLAVCDYRTVHEDDRVPTDIVFPDYLGETYNFRPSPKHRFYYVDEQQVDEAWMVKCFDSASLKDDNIAQFSPHVSFTYQTNEPRVLRESIEVRTFVFFA